MSQVPDETHWRARAAGQQPPTSTAARPQSVPRRSPAAKAKLGGAIQVAGQVTTPAEGLTKTQLGADGKLLTLAQQLQQARDQAAKPKAPPKTTILGGKRDLAAEANAAASKLTPEQKKELGRKFQEATAADVVVPLQVNQPKPATKTTVETVRTVETASSAAKPESKDAPPSAPPAAPPVDVI